MSHALTERDNSIVNGRGDKTTSKAKFFVRRGCIYGQLKATGAKDTRHRTRMQLVLTRLCP